MRVLRNVMPVRQFDGAVHVGGRAVGTAGAEGLPCASNARPSAICHRATQEATYGAMSPRAVTGGNVVTGGYCWLQVGAGGYRQLPAVTGSYRR